MSRRLGRPYACTEQQVEQLLCGLAQQRQMFAQSLDQALRFFGVQDHALGSRMLRALNRMSVAVPSEQIATRIPMMSESGPSA